MSASDESNNSNNNGSRSVPFQSGARAVPPPPPPRPPRNVGGSSSSPSASGPSGPPSSPSVLPPPPRNPDGSSSPQLASSLRGAAPVSVSSSSPSSQPSSSIRNMAAQLNGRININPAAQLPQRPKSAAPPVSDNKEEKKLNPKEPPVWIRAGVLEQKTIDLWNRSGEDEAAFHTFIGITRIDNGMMYARPCFYQIFDQLFLLNGEEAKEDIRTLYGDDYVTIEMTPKLLLQKIETELDNPSVLAEDKAKFTQVKTALEAAGKVTEQKAQKEAQIKAMVPVIKDNALQRHLIDGMGHQALANKIRPIELKNIPPKQRQLMGEQPEPIKDSVVLGWAVKGSLAYLKLVDNREDVDTEYLQICAFSSGRNTDKFAAPHKDRHLPNNYALQTMYALNEALVMGQKFKHSTIKLLPPKDIYKNFPVDRLKNENIKKKRKEAFKDLATHLATLSAPMPVSEPVGLARSPGAPPPQPQSASGASISQSALSLGGAAPVSVSSSSSSSPPLPPPPRGGPPIAGRAILSAVVSAEARRAAPAPEAAPLLPTPQAEIARGHQVPQVMLERVRALEAARRAAPAQQNPSGQRFGPCGPGQQPGQ